MSAVVGCTGKYVKSTFGCMFVTVIVLFVKLVAPVLSRMNKTTL